MVDILFSYLSYINISPEILKHFTGSMVILALVVEHFQRISEFLMIHPQPQRRDHYFQMLTLPILTTKGKIDLCFKCELHTD
jgi:hypothetical protein